MGQALVIQYIHGVTEPKRLLETLDHMVDKGDDKCILIMYFDQDANGQHTRQTLTVRQVRDKIKQLWKMDSTN